VVGRSGNAALEQKTKSSQPGNIRSNAEGGGSTAYRGRGMAGVNKLTDKGLGGLKEEKTRKPGEMNLSGEGGPLGVL